MRNPTIMFVLAAGLVSITRASLAQAPDPEAPPPASATTETAPNWSASVTPRLGLVQPTSKLGMMVIAGVQIDYATSALDHHLLIGLDWSITRPSHDGSVMDPRLPEAATYSVHETEMVIALLASYHSTAKDAKLTPWIGAGPMLHLLRTTETTSVAPGENSDVSTELGVEIAGGADLPVGPGRLGGELRLAYSKLDHAITGSTNAGNLSVALGYRLTF